MQIKSIKKVSKVEVCDISVDNAEHHVLENGVVSHNRGAEYAADTIVFLSKAQDKDKDGTHIGTIVTARTTKSRFTREKSSVKLKISFDHGLDRYYGLVDIALRGEVFEKSSTRIKLPDGTTAFESQIYKNPQKYFTPEVLAQIDVAAGNLFKFGGSLGHKADGEAEDETEDTGITPTEE